MESEKDSV